MKQEIYISEWLEKGYKVVYNQLKDALSPKHDCDSDLAAFKAFKHIFKKKTIHQVYVRPLIKDGGALHCVTWNHYM